MLTKRTPKFLNLSLVPKGHPVHRVPRRSFHAPGPPHRWRHHGEPRYFTSADIKMRGKSGDDTDRDLSLPGSQGRDEGSGLGPVIGCG
jgi:hypothetical protein